jgi:gamma-glutamyl:cysteine ligase YbdK (ATP-grasp superfamily)
MAMLHYVEFAAIPHIIAKSAKYPPVMGIATGCTTSRKNITAL